MSRSWLARSDPMGVVVGERVSVAQPARVWRYGWLAAVGLSAALAFVAQFHHFREFGLYEDDYFFISEAMGQDPSYLARRLVTALTVFPQGRPFGFFLPDLFSFAGDKLGGLPAIYLLGFAVVTLNTFLCYRLLRWRLPLAPAAVGAAVFCLFPADTTKIFLTHDFQLQPSLTFALLSALAFMAGRRPLAYVLGAGALLSYENGFLALFGLPLFAHRWDRRTVRELAMHGAILIGVVALVAGIRVVTGEGRAANSAGSAGGILLPLLGSLVIGPARSLAGMVYGPVRAVTTWDVEALLSAALAGVGAITLLWWSRAGRSQGVRAALEIIGAGGVMLIAGYALAFTHFPPNALVGRGTSVHLGATIGMSVLAAGLAWLVLQNWPRVAATLLAVYVALMAGYYVTIERDFIRSWQLQRAFWQQVVACCSDLQDGTVLLYELNAADEPTFIFTNSWADPLVLGETLSFPKTWSTPPRLFSLTEWHSRLEWTGDHFRWWVPGATWEEHWEDFPSGNVILLRPGVNGTLERATGSTDVGSHAIALKSSDAPIAFPPAQLYDPLLR